MHLTSDEIAFLLSQHLTPSDVLDAKGMSVAQRHQLAKQQGKLLVLIAVCTKDSSHRFRTYGGNHCVQCHTSKIAYQKRRMTTGYVYIAGSERSKIIKIGGTGAIREREQSLCHVSYGGADDWKILCHTEVPRFGEVEGNVISALRPFALERQYIKGGKRQMASEMFTCSYAVARQAMDDVLKRMELQQGKFITSPLSLHY